MNKFAVFGRGLLRRTYLLPTVVGLISILGLVTALIGDGAWNLASWLALGVPVSVTLWFWLLAPLRNARSLSL